LILITPAKLVKLRCKLHGVYCSTSVSKVWPTEHSLNLIGVYGLNRCLLYNMVASTLHFVLNTVEVAALCAHLSPASPQTIAKETFKQWLQSSNRFACVCMTDAQIAVFYFFWWWCVFLLSDTGNSLRERERERESGVVLCTCVLYA
jgi:hypothetical protein